ncbi:MAG: substrate-binding domain-containing protein [Lutibacter sp.]|nr:substrate-binding domain-containing protein [Lutibacter sp.]
MITIKKIAEIANVSPGTVDRIIHNRGQVSQENVDKVNAIIKEYGFKKNIFASNLAFNKKFRFVVFLPKNEGLEYWQAPIDGIEKASEEFSRFGVIIDYNFYKYDSVSFKKMALKVLTLDCDGLLFAPIFKEDSILFLDEFKKKKIPIVMIDSNIKEIEGVSYIGQDAFKSGYLAARLISFAKKEENKVLIIKLTREIENTSVYLQRIKGFYSFFEDHVDLTNFKFTEINIENSDVNKLNTKMFEGVDSIFIPNSRTHIVAQFLMENKIKGIRIVGYDLLKKNIQFLEEGTIDFLINQKPEEQGYLGISHLYKKLVLNEEVEETFYMPLEIIIKENYYTSQ